MGVRESLPVAIAAALIGLGAGYSISALTQDGRTTAAAGPSAQRPQVQATPAASERAPDLRLQPQSVERTTAPAAAVEASAPRLAQGELARAIDAVRAPKVQAARGQGVITGEATDEWGAPLTGVLVVATPIDGNRTDDPSAVGGGAPTDSTLEEYLRTSADRWARTHGLAQRATTGVDGRFEFAGLPDNASFSLAAYLADHVLEAEGSAYGASPGQHLVFRAEAVRRVPVRLVLADGGTPSDGVVGVKRGDEEELFTWSAAAPELRLAPGRVALRGYAGVLRAEGYRNEVDSSHASGALSLDVGDHAGAPIELVLEPRRGIRGRIVDESGTSGGHMMVRVLALGDASDLDLEGLADSGRSTRPNGAHFHLLDLDPGLYAVGLTDYSESLYAHELVTVGEGVSEVDLVVSAPDPEEHLVVRAFGPSGRALRDLSFHFRSSTPNGAQSGTIRGRRAVDGTWWLRPRSEFFAPWRGESAYLLTVKHAEFGERVVELDEGQRELEITFDEPVTLVVLVSGYAGSGYVGKLQLAVSPVTDGGASNSSMNHVRRMRGNQDVSFSPEGVARLENIAPGRWKVDLLAETGEWQTRLLQSREVTALSGEVSLTMDLPLLYDLVVVAPGLDAGGYLFLSPRDSQEGTTHFGDATSHMRLDGDHRAVFKGLAAGDYVLRGNTLTDPIDVTVPCGEVFIDAKEPDCLRVAIGDMEGAMYKAGLRAGDLIVALDGVAYSSSGNWFEGFFGKGESELSVLRDGKTLAISFPRIPGGPEGWSELGGMLTPTSRP